MAVHQIDDFSLPEEGELVAVEVDGTDVAVAVLDGQLHAFDDTCPHAGCSLAEGELEDQTVVCPCHFARFDITTGAVVEGTATLGVSIWAARFQDGTLQLDGPQDPPAGADSPETASDGQAGPDRDITVLIVREHDTFRRQFAALEQMSDPQELQQAWSALADLLEIHASGEEAVLYPTRRPCSTPPWSGLTSRPPRRPSMRCGTTTRSGTACVRFRTTRSAARCGGRRCAARGRSTRTT